MRDVQSRLATAPISWGVSEVPGWGYQAAPDDVLSSMRELGFTATEFGPEGFLPAEPEQRREVLAKHQLDAVGGFYPAVLHEAVDVEQKALAAELEAFVATGARTLVLAIDTGLDGYDSRPELTDEQWDTIHANVRHIQRLATDFTINVALHPHIGTVVQNADEVARVVDATSVGLCLDTGHLAAAGVDVLDFTRTYRDRIVHTHLKDVNAAVAERYRNGEFTFTQAVQNEGMFVPLGTGDLPFEEIIEELLKADYQGWYVHEQDRKLNGPEDVEHANNEARESFEFLKKVTGL